MQLLAKENVVSKVVDELTVRKMKTPSGIYSNSSTPVGKECVENKKNIVEVANNENTIDSFKILGEFEPNGEMDIEYVYDKEKSMSNTTKIELDRNMIKIMEAASDINEDSNILPVALIDPTSKNVQLMNWITLIIIFPKIIFMVLPIDIFMIKKNDTRIMVNFK